MNQADCVRLQIEALHRIMDLGHCPIAPLLSHFAEITRQRPYEEWIACCLATVDRCDALIRLGGESKGADREVSRAIHRRIPVFRSWETLESWLEQPCREMVKETNAWHELGRSCIS
jgi:flagellar biosynthesis/type III secretory pathway ATPase